jgi:hypothetical protein
MLRAATIVSGSSSMSRAITYVAAPDLDRFREIGRGRNELRPRSLQAKVFLGTRYPVTCLLLVKNFAVDP